MTLKIKYVRIQVYSIYACLLYTSFALWLGSKEAQEIQGKSGTVISARNDCQELFLDTHKDLNLQVFLDNVPNTELLPHCKVTAKLSQVEKTYLEQAWQGEITLEEALSLINICDPCNQ